MSNLVEQSAGKDTGQSNPTLDYWSYVYATTQSEALKQKAALILGIKEEKK
ncbi:MAG: hypothetical protein [Caudoviricetes sp.]|nr:MAG: hypothetical protein [Caudoviricetes sp.]